MKTKVLLTGATGYIGKRLLPELVTAGYYVVCCVRDKKRFRPPSTLRDSVEVVEADFLDAASLHNLPSDVQGAYFLMHAMSSSSHYEDLEQQMAQNFVNYLSNTKAEHCVYLSGMANSESLSRHLNSRKQVEEVLGTGSFALTTLRAGIIIGSGSASFEIIRDLVEKLPFMVAPKWLKTRCQPIAIRDVIQFLNKSLFKQELYDKNFDIGGPDILSYKEMLLGYAKVRGLRRFILSVPFMTPRLSSYWLYFVTSTSFKLAAALVDSMRVEVVCRPSDIASILGIKPLPYKKALKKTLLKVESNQIISSWKDAMVAGRMNINLSDFINVPSHGCFKDHRERKAKDKSAIIERVWSIGGNTGWYYGTWLWKLRGFFDLVFGGVGLRRGRTNEVHLRAGDALDFWRVIYANKSEGRLLLFAEMKLPGEAWLEFRLHEGVFVQEATFRPKGIWGRLYWYSVWPFHGFIFKGMINRITS